MGNVPAKIDKELGRAVGANNLTGALSRAPAQLDKELGRAVGAKNLTGAVSRLPAKLDKELGRAVGANNLTGYLWAPVRTEVIAPVLDSAGLLPENHGKHHFPPGIDGMNHPEHIIDRVVIRSLPFSRALGPMVSKLAGLPFEHHYVMGRLRNGIVACVNIAYEGDIYLTLHASWEDADKYGCSFQLPFADPGSPTTVAEKRCDKVVRAWRDIIRDLIPAKYKLYGRGMHNCQTVSRELYNYI